MSHDDALQGADVVVRGRFRNQPGRPGAAPEVNGGLAVPEDSGLTSGCVTTHLSRSAIAEAIGVEEAEIRVRTAAVGGGFGAKIPAYAEQAVVAAFALRLGVPVRYVETRSESFVAMTHGRDQTQDVEMGASRDGRIVGLRRDVLADLGAYPDEGHDPGVHRADGRRPVRDPSRRRRDPGASSRTSTPRGVPRRRASGGDRADRARGRHARRRGGIDPAEIRRRRLHPRVPHRTVTDASYDSRPTSRRSTRPSGCRITTRYGASRPSVTRAIRGCSVSASRATWRSRAGATSTRGSRSPTTGR